MSRTLPSTFGFHRRLQLASNGLQRLYGLPLALSFKPFTPAGCKQLVLCFGLFHCLVMTHGASVSQYLALSEPKKFVQLRSPVLKKYLLALKRLILSVVQPHDDNAVQSSDFILREVVLRNRHVALMDRPRLPALQAHVHGGMIGPGEHQFCSSLSHGSDVQLVLHDLEESRSVGAQWIIVGGQRKDLLDTQVHTRLTGTDVTDAFQHFIIVVRGSNACHDRVFEAFIVEDKAFHQILSQMVRCPLTELGASERTHSVSYCEDSVQVVVLHCAMDAVLAVGY